MRVYDIYLRWKEKRDDTNVEGNISPNYRAFEGGYSEGLKTGFFAGMGAGVIVSLLFFGFANQASKNLEKKVQNPTITVETSR